MRAPRRASPEPRRAGSAEVEEAPSRRRQRALTEQRAAPRPGAASDGGASDGGLAAPAPRHRRPSRGRPAGWWRAGRAAGGGARPPAGSGGTVATAAAPTSRLPVGRRGCDRSGLGAPAGTMTGGATGAPTGTGVATRGGVDGYWVAAAMAASRLRRPRLTPVRIKTSRPRITPSAATRQRADQPGHDRRHDVLAERDREVTLAPGLHHHAVRARLVDLDAAHGLAGVVAERVVEGVLGSADVEVLAVLRDGDGQAGGWALRPAHGLGRAAAPALGQVLADLAVALVVDGVGAGLLEADRGRTLAVGDLEAPEVVDGVLEGEEPGHRQRQPAEQPAGQQQRPQPVPALARFDLGGGRRRLLRDAGWREGHGQVTPRRSTTRSRRSRGCTTATRTWSAPSVP